ncbi:hypothetical protein ACFVWY_13575, partial [Streptomyces sp. NPDC058195]|uniref:hypothetical protein n=1 Tax=Streptomyces sp. NPDC058195 TaxID=3346375 RepID=UPI0036E83E27
MFWFIGDGSPGVCITAGTPHAHSSGTAGEGLGKSGGIKAQNIASAVATYPKGRIAEPAMRSLCEVDMSVGVSGVRITAYEWMKL